MKLIKVELDVDGKMVEYEFKASLNILKQAEQLSGITFPDAFQEARVKGIMPIDFITALVYRGANCNGYNKSYEYFLDNHPIDIITEWLNKIAEVITPEDMQPDKETKSDGDSEPG